MHPKLFFLLLFSLTTLTLYAQSGVVLSGTVQNEADQPIAGATIYLLNSTSGTLTDDKGAFQLNLPAAGNYTLRVSAIGYATRLVAVSDAEARAYAVATNAPFTLRLAESLNRLEEVLVTAQKTEENPQQVPVAISTISGRQVQDYRLWNSKDITALVPNLYAANPGDERNNISLRGITSTSYDPAVATYIDGVNQFNLDTYIAQLIDVERIEVLRGPQGTLYGRNAMGGVINIITRQPDNQKRALAELSIGTYGQQRYAAALRSPLIKNKLFAGLSGVYDKRGGFYTNLYNNEKFDRFESFTGNYFLRYVASPKLFFNLNIKHNHNRNNGSFPVEFPPAAFNNPFTVNQNAITRTFDNTFNVSLTVQHYGKAIDVTSITAFQYNNRYYQDPIDADFSPKQSQTIENNFDKKDNAVQVLTQEIRISSAARQATRLKWTAGTYFFYEHNPTKVAVNAYVAPTSAIRLTSTNTANNTGIAFFGQATYALTPKLSLTAGIRFDDEQKKLNGIKQKRLPTAITDIKTYDSSAVASFTAVSPKASLSYQLHANALAYLTYARGFRSGGFTQISVTTADAPLYTFQPEFSNNFEAGVKQTAFDNHLKANLTFFYITVNNAQVPTLRPDAGFVTVTQNAGQLESKGIELELAATPLKGIQLDFNFGITDARYNTLRQPNGKTEINYDGNRPVLTPATTSLLALQYTLPLTRHVSLLARGEWRYLGKQYFKLSNTLEQGDYSVLNAKVGIRAAKAELTFWGRNLADRKYIAYGYDFGAVSLGNPQNFGFTISSTF